MMRVVFERSLSMTVMDDGGMVVLAQRTGTMYRCNHTAATFWSALERHDGDVAKAADHIAACYGIDLSRAQEDLQVLVDEMRSAGLVRTAA
jgi:hypothetical protein